jgi:hypothetical protein
MDIDDDFDKALKPPRPPKEKSLEARLREWCVSHGWIYQKNEGLRNFPDRTIIGPGWVCFLELKRKGHRPRTGQLQTIHTLQDLGHHADWADDFDQAIQILTKISNER